MSGWSDSDEEAPLLRARASAPQPRIMSAFEALEEDYTALASQLSKHISKVSASASPGASHAWIGPLALTAVSSCGERGAVHHCRWLLLPCCWLPLPHPPLCAEPFAVSCWFCCLCVSVCLCVCVCLWLTMSTCVGLPVLVSVCVCCPPFPSLFLCVPFSVFVVTVVCSGSKVGGRRCQCNLQKGSEMRTYAMVSTLLVVSLLLSWHSLSTHAHITLSHTRRIAGDAVYTDLWAGKGAA